MTKPADGADGAGDPRIHPVVPDYPEDAFAGTAEYYARYRVPYPPALFDTLCRRAGITGAGRLLDLACGTGQVALPLAPRFREVWAVDQEPDMIRVGRRAAAAAGIDNVIWQQGRAEEVAAPAGGFELVTVGNAFHRLHRRLVGRKAIEWLAPGCCFAVLGSNSLWTGTADWQPIVRDVVARWRCGTPSGRRNKPNEPTESFEQALQEAGLEEIARSTFPVSQVWSLDALVGYLYSLSGVSRRVLGDNAAPFEADLRQALLAYDETGAYAEVVEFFLILCRRPD